MILVSQAYDLAIKLHLAGDLQQAEQWYRQILAAVPEHAPAWQMLGVVAHQRGDNDRAIEYIRRALHLNPALVEAFNNLGMALAAQGKLDDAIASYRQALEMKPNCAEAHLNLGNIMKKLGRLAEAIDHYECARQLQPESAPTHANLGNVLTELGRRDEAAASFREALRLNPRHVLAWWHLAQASQLIGDDLGRIESLLAQTDWSPHDRGLLHRSLAVTLDRQGDYDAAWLHFQAANELKQEVFRQQGQAFELAEFRDLVDRQIATFDESFFRTVQPAANASELPVFVVGMPRSGTTLVEQILASHSQVFGAGELYAIADLIGSLKSAAVAESYPACLRGLSCGQLNDLASRYLANLAQLGGQASRVVDKMPGNFAHLGFIALLFPQARVIHCRRDPLDLCLSCYFQNFTRISYSLSLEGLGQYYREYERLAAHWQRVLPMKTLEIRYETLVARQEPTSRVLLAFCGLDWEPGCLAFHANTRPVQTASVHQVRQPIYASSIGRWKHYEAHLAPLKRSLGDVINAT